MAGGPPSPAKRSFIDLFTRSTSDSSLPFKESSIYRGEPALRFSAEEVVALASSFQFALVGKFSNGRPSMAILRKSFSKIDLKGSIKLGLLDKRHILIRAENEDDFLRFRLRKFWNFEGFVMRIFKWTPDFRTDIESPLVPVWVSFESLPIFMFNKGSLFSLARIIGTPLKIDAATSDLSRPSVARVCVEVDLRLDLPKRIWLDIGSFGFWQPILYEDLPKYCQSCCKVGHLADVCVSMMPELQKAAAAPPLPKSKWMPKPIQNLPLAEKNAAPLFSAIPNEVLLVSPATDLASAAAVLPSTSSVFPAVDFSGGSAVSAASAAVDFSAVSLAKHKFPCGSLANTAAIALSPTAVALPAVAFPSAIPANLSVLSSSEKPPAFVTEHTFVSNAAEPIVVHLPTVNEDAVPATVLCGNLNPNAPLFNPQKQDYAESSKPSFAALLGVQQPPPVPVKSRFLAVKSSEFPLFKLPQFDIFYPPSSLIPLDEPESSRSRKDIFTFSDGDDVPRLPSSRQVLSSSLRSFHRKIQAKFSKRRSLFPLPKHRKNWKKLAPITRPGTFLPSSIQPPLQKFQTYYGPNPHEEQSDDDASVAYENVWRSSSSEGEFSNDFDYPLESIDALMALEYDDFSLSPPRRRKYNKRFRDLPPPLPTRRSRPKD